MVFDLQQVRRYLTEPNLRARILEQVVQAVGDDTRVMVAHSLGSVVAYEALCAHPEWPVRALVTLGSPLGIRNLIFDRLRPAPSPVSGSNTRLRGAWPWPVREWTNIADTGDVVALVKDLRPLFGDRVRGFLVSNGAKAHDILPYLTAPETGAAIHAGLAD
jgi:pimeloyl-ACP methyl ester carboxylesterase